MLYLAGHQSFKPQGFRHSKQTGDWLMWPKVLRKDWPNCCPAPPEAMEWTPCPTAHYCGCTDTRDHGLVGLRRGCYTQQDAGKTKKSASGTADSAPHPITTTMNSAYNKSFSRETKFTQSAGSSLCIHLSLNCHTYPFTVCCENNWKEF